MHTSRWMMPILAALGVAIIATGAAAAAKAVNPAPTEPLNPARVAAVAAMLPEKPAGVGRPIGDRAAWEALAAQPAIKATIAQAGQLLKTPLPEQPDDLYLEYSRVGNRSRWQRVAVARRTRLPVLVVAECLENKGRFLPAIESLVAALAAEKTWVYPAHDGALNNFNGKSVDIDLFSSALGWNLATADYLLGDRLSPAARQTLRENVARRVIKPYLDMVTGARPRNGWMTTTNNWNAVCLAGVTGSVLALAESRQERAQAVVAAEKYSKYGLAGFTPDGYCSEGLGYWNYGFGHYVLLAETVRQATGGKVDLMALPAARPPAAFGSRIQIQSGIAPAFADCAVGTAPYQYLTFYLNRRFGLGLVGYDAPDLEETLKSLPIALIHAFPNAASAAPAPAAGKGPALHDWFEQAGILISRPAPGGACRMGVALKGGHNAEHHNHNDVGSYVVVLGDEAVLLDPGRETYTKRTFSGRRYDGKLLNSYGHPVPVVAGQLQQPGAQHKATVLKADFTETADTLALDIAAAYAVPDLAALERTFVYSRTKAGGLTVTDRVAFKTPQSFATAVLTLGTWKPAGDRAFIVTSGKQSVRVEVDAGDVPFAFRAEEIVEDAPVRPTRIAIELARPVTAATVRLTITPVEP